MKLALREKERNKYTKITAFSYNPNPHMFKRRIMIDSNYIKQQPCKELWNPTFWGWSPQIWVNLLSTPFKFYDLLTTATMQELYLSKVRRTVTIQSRLKRIRYACNATNLKRNGRFPSTATTIFGIQLKSTVSQQLSKEDGFVKSHQIMHILRASTARQKNSKDGNVCSAQIWDIRS